MSLSERNLTLLCDFYELTMARGYFNSKIKNKIAYFDVFFRRVPDGGGYAISVGLDGVIDYIKSLRFDDSDTAFQVAEDHHGITGMNIEHVPRFLRDHDLALFAYLADAE